MPGSMPYSIEKGPYFSVIEDFANGSASRAVDALLHLRGPGLISELDAFDSTTLDAGPYTTVQLREHLNTDWFGFTLGAAGGWQPQPPFQPGTSASTGFWKEWYGNAEGVLRLTLIRALEISLGLDHGEAPTKPPSQHWHIEMFWRCPIPWFEGWVTWRKHDEGRRGGQVTVIISTPGHGHPLRNTPIRTNEPQRSGYARDPLVAAGKQGMWVISESYHRPFPKQITVESGLGEWSFPSQGLSYASEGAIVTVAPPEREGGVLNPPRQWMPHP